MPDEEEIHLSDAFSKEMQHQMPALECRVRLININAGHNKELLGKLQAALGIHRIYRHDT